MASGNEEEARGRFWEAPLEAAYTEEDLLAFLGTTADEAQPGVLASLGSVASLAATPGAAGAAARRSRDLSAPLLAAEPFGTPNGLRLHLYWSGGKNTENLGDYLSVFLARAMGYEVTRRPGAARVLAGGTLLDDRHFSALVDVGGGEDRAVVWGAGAGIDLYGLTGERRGIAPEFRAVRGPLTRDLLGLDPALPVGDPALLLPRWLSRERLRRLAGPRDLPPVGGEALYVANQLEEELPSVDGADAAVSARTHIRGLPALMARIASARFILTSSLAAAALAHAYGVPWAPCAPRLLRINRFKWADLLLSLGVRCAPSFVIDHAGGADWWEEWGRHARSPDLDALQGAFPHDCAVPVPTLPDSVAAPLTVPTTPPRAVKGLATNSVAGSAAGDGAGRTTARPTVRGLVPRYWWRKSGGGIDGGAENLGDYLSVLLLRAMGYETVPWGERSARRGRSATACLMAIGTNLSDAKYAEIDAPSLVVWGSGAGYDMCDLYGERSGARDRLSFRAVRGPLTRDLLGLPADTPLGDPAVLLPLYWPTERLPPPDAGGAGRVVYVPHWEEPGGSRPPGSDFFLSPLVTPAGALGAISTIAHARFVLTSSLHGAILAQAYGVPWAPCLHPPLAVRRRPARINRFKWADWFLYLGLERATPAFVDDADAGVRWWKEHGRGGSIRDTDRLLRAFPRDAVLPPDPAASPHGAPGGGAAGRAAE